MSIASEINRIQQNVTDSLAAVANKGVTVPTGSTSDDLPDLIAQITGGGGTTWETLYDYSIWISSDNPNYFIINNYTDAISANQTYRITWGSGGTQYICHTIVDERGQTYDGYVVGNVGIVGSTPDTGEPFFLYRDNATRMLGVTNASSGNWHITIELQTSSGGNYQDKTGITPTTSSQTIYPDSGYDALSSVQINAMPSGTAGTPTATKGTVSNHSVSITPSVTNTTGYITGSTLTGTAVTVTASELVSGSETKIANGTYDVTNLAELVVAVSSSGLNYETGTYTPSQDVAEPLIYYSNSHTDTPIFIVFEDATNTYADTKYSNQLFIYCDFEKILGASLYPSSTSMNYVFAFYRYRTTNVSSFASSNTFMSHPSSDTTESSNSYPRYWANTERFRPNSNSSTRYWRAGRTYKWIAVWAPTA